jgi:hypothetical protein
MGGMREDRMIALESWGAVTEALLSPACFVRRYVLWQQLTLCVCESACVLACARESACTGVDVYRKADEYSRRNECMSIQLWDEYRCERV